MTDDPISVSKQDYPANPYRYTHSARTSPSERSIARGIVLHLELVRAIASLAVWCYPDVLVAWNERVVEETEGKAEMLRQCKIKGNADYHEDRLLEARIK